MEKPLWIKIYQYSLLAVFQLLLFNGWSQSCTTLGQTPATAFPVCGTGVFSKGNVPSCTNRTVIVPGCNNQNTYADANPFWYKFTCFQSGTLGLTIDPVSANDDYDWQVWDITGIDPNTVYNNGSRVVVANWSGLLGQTGTSSSARNLIECGSFNNNNPPKFSRLPNITAGRTYLLMVSNFSNSQQGYKLSFGGGTAVITDPKLPLMQEVKTNCGGDQLRLKMNKKMKCSSVATDGSDIVDFPGGIKALKIDPVNCSSSFETDSVVIFLSAPLPPGTYTLNLKKGTDGNTFLDLCDRPVPETDQLIFQYQIPQPTPFDSLAPLKCAPQELRFIFKKPIKCTSIDPAGSDFAITGTYPVTITGARGNCNSDNLSSEIIVSLSQPLQLKGNFVVSIKSGLDGNTIIDECNQITPPSQIRFSVKDTVNADFNYTIKYGCVEDTVNYTHPGGNEINQWFWNFGGGLTGSKQNETVLYKSFDVKTTLLVVSNGFCTDTSTQKIDLDNSILSVFSVDPFHCPNEPVLITGNPVSRRPTTHLWNFGDGFTSTLAQPNFHLYPVVGAQRNYIISYTITNYLGCSSTSEKTITVLMTCRIDVPNAFSPNGDGLNDFFGPLNAIKAEQMVFRVFNRWGNLLFESQNWLKQWDGRYKLTDQPADTYVWYLSYTNRDTKKRVEQKGTVVLIR
jgi:gliding motility-associated-like protein